MPALRQLVTHCRTLALPEITLLLQSTWHQQRLLALLILVDQFKRGDRTLQGAIYKLYLSQTRYINNWDLIHKAVGWMLREVGKRKLQLEETFLAQHYHEMPRNMLRYAIEKFPEARRQDWLRGRIDSAIQSTRTSMNISPNDAPTHP